MAFVATHESIVPDPPRVSITYYDPEVGHIAVGKADSVEHHLDGRDGTLLQGEEKMPVAVFKGDAIVEYEEPKHVHAVLRPSDVGVWFKPVQPDSRIPALPERSAFANKFDHIGDNDK